MAAALAFLFLSCVHNHRIAEVGRGLWSSASPTLSLLCRFSYSTFLKAISSHILNISKDREATNSPSILFEYFHTHRKKNSLVTCVSAAQKPPGLFVLCIVACTDGGNTRPCSELAQKLMANILCQCSNAEQHSLWPGMMQDKNV